MPTHLQRTDEYFAPVVPRHLALPDEGDGSDEGLYGTRKLPRRGIGHSTGDGTAGDGPVPRHDVLELGLGDGGRALQMA